jgi:quercetin dioxygenase-like cupin family protein
MLGCGSSRWRSLRVPIVEIGKLPVFERLPGWFGRYFHSAHMTIAHYEFLKGASIREHHHSQEEVYEVIEGELEVTIGGAVHVVKPGVAAIVPGGVAHSVRALTNGRAIIVDSPTRPDS